MNKVLVTGLAIAKEVNACDSCNFDMSWIVNYPSILLWTDKILITQTINDRIYKAEVPAVSEKFSKTLKIIFDYLYSESMIDIIEPNSIITDEVIELIYKEIEQDRNLLPKYFPDQIKIGDETKVPGQLFVNKAEYCSPHLFSIYASLLLSKKYNAESLFGIDVFNYVKYKFGSNSISKNKTPGKIESFHNIFQAYIPNIPVLPTYAYNKDSQCNTCSNSEACKDKYLYELESGMEEIISWRKYDEIHQLKSVINKIVDLKEQSGEILDPEEIAREFKEERDKIQKRVNNTFPKIKRWANLSTILSIPTAIAGLSTGNASLTIAGASLAGLSKITKEAIDYLNSSYNWLAFTNRLSEKKD